jgi:hypothetical protein
MAAGDLITADGQLEFNGYLLGDDVITFMTNLTGWEDLPPIDSSNTLRPTSHGAWVGKKLAGQRILTWSGKFAPEDTGNWNTLLEALQDATTIPIGTEEKAIVVRTRGNSKLVFGTVSARSIPMDYAYSYYGANVTLQFECSDPRKYSLGENTLFISMPEDSEDGLDYPLDYPLDYGIENPSNNLNIINVGNAPTPVILNYYGPATNPTLINSTTNQQLGFEIVLTADDVLTVNTRVGTVLLNGTADRLYTRTITSSPILGFELQSGENELTAFASSWSTGAGIEIIYRDASF